MLAMTENNHLILNKETLYLPDGIEIKYCEKYNGCGLFATKIFPLGSIIYTTQYVTISNKYTDFRLIVGNGQEKLNSDAQFIETEQYFYHFNSFMNHSCEPSSLVLEFEKEYAMKALRDIHVGDEITCDYCTFEYDCNDKRIEKCCCGSIKCRGEILGYKYLRIEDKKALLDHVGKSVLINMTNATDNKFLYIDDICTPTDSIQIVSSIEYDACKAEVVEDVYQQVAKKDFDKDDIIFSVESLLFEEDSVVVVNVNNKRKWLNNIWHTINMGEGMRQFNYFDTFQNHSCDPNTKLIYHSRIKYDVIALRNIKSGEELTSDYETFDDCLDGSVFTCNCKSTNCRGAIKG